MAVRIESQAEPIPGYKLMERLGGGGFGEVWKAEAPGGLHKAIKFVYGDLKTSGEGDGHRAEQELKALSRVKTVRHPYILSLERYDIIDGQLIIVMELADRNLWDRFRDYRAQGAPGIPRDELLRYMEEAAEALDLMNIEHQLQHLDIKPQNLFLMHNHTKVADFGLVKDLEGMMASVTGGVTPVYAAPETFDGWVSRYCDQYSLAIVYQELLTGQRPFNGTNVRQLILQHLQASPNLESLPEADRPPIARALSKNPEQRFSTCRDFVAALKGVHAAPRTGGLDEAAIFTQQSRPADTPSFPVAAKENGDADSGRAAADGDQPGPEARSTRWIRVHAEAKRKDETPTAAPVKREVIQGDGHLFPALLIGLGRQGLNVLLRLREQLDEEFGAADLLPNLRWLYIDTDPESARYASSGEQAFPFHPGEILLTKLNRPSHYLRPQAGRPSLESWFDPKMIYRIPRSLMTMGMRALGRLAFIDNYRAIARRLQSELEACADEAALATAAERSGQGIRTNQPKVYLVTGLAGGSGGGMFLDMAYVVRSLLHQQDLGQPEVTGAFLLPAADRQSNRTLPLGNAFAALTELNHFSSSTTTFVARYDEKEPAITSKEAPFDRCILVEMSQGNDDNPCSEAIEAIADLLRRELTSPLGRLADERRAAQLVCQPPVRELTCQVFGIQRISWPKRVLTRAAASRLCQQVVACWMSKDAALLREAIRASVAEFWTQHQLDGEHLTSSLQSACEQVLEKTMDDAFAAALSTLSGIETQPAGDQFVALVAALDNVEKLVGVPEGGSVTRIGDVAEPLGAASDRLIGKWCQKLTTFAFALVEQPSQRLAGAEETIRQVTGTIEQTLVHYEGLAKELAARAAEAHQRFAKLLPALQLPPPPKGRPAVTVSTLAELLTAYARWRFQSLLLQRLTAIYVSLRGRLSDQLREINYCRARLVELQRNFEAAAAQAAETTAANRQILPAGCRKLEDAIHQLTDGVNAEALRELDSKIQRVIQEKFVGLAHVCMTSANLLEDVQEAMQQQAENFVGARLSAYDLAEMYLAQVGGEQQAEGELASAFAEAAPPFHARASAQQGRINILAVPAGPSGQRILEISRKALSDAELATTTAANEIVFYQEISHLPLSDLEQLGPLAYEAYTQICAVEHFTPHSRTDIVEWRAATAS